MLGRRPNQQRLTATTLNQRGVTLMELLVVVVIVAAIGAWIYSSGHKSGKREGSRKGYGVGFDRGKKSRGNGSGCLLVLAAGIMAAVGTAALAFCR